MKYYYNGKIVRTSKNEYKYAAININTGKVISCSATYEGATTEPNRMKSETQRGYENAQNAIQAIANGLKYYNAKIGRTSERIKITHDKEYYEQDIKYLENRINYLNENIKVVELEKRD